MEKHLSNLIVLVLAFSFSVFTTNLAKKNEQHLDYYTLSIQANPISIGTVSNVRNWVNRNTVECGTSAADEMACQITTVSDLYLHDTTIGGTIYQTPNTPTTTPVGEFVFGEIIEAIPSGGATYYVVATNRGTAANKTLPE